ncbi:lipid-A-disaccharide synthase [Burkholderiales bacterium GJ-E10]|nr:lipid-A-disaccharide synthase [Burkholderiales bacterium GJ-E10]
MSERIAFVAGEASGDLLAAPVVAALRRHDPPYAAAGIAGDRMIAAGCEAWHHVRELSVRGYVEVLRELPRLLRLRRGVFERLVASRCAALVGVDSPDFNLALEAKARGAGIPTVHYVSPSIWAWRGGRIERIRKAADRVLLVFPFEQEIYDRAGIPASYVGHPMASEIPMNPDADAARARLGLDGSAGKGSPIVALLPGSRRAEVEYIGPVFLDAAREIARAHPAARFLLPVADRSLRAMVESQIASRPEVQERLHWFDGRSHDCLEACDAVLVASGTATLEAALYKRPMVIAYRMPVSSAWIMRRIGGYLPWVGLPNILAGAAIVPELLQERATAPAIARALLDVLADEAGRRRLHEHYCVMHESLQRDTPALATAAILQTMETARRKGQG